MSFQIQSAVIVYQQKSGQTNQFVLFSNFKRYMIRMENKKTVKELRDELAALGAKKTGSKKVLEKR